MANKQPLRDFIRDNIQNIRVEEPALDTITELFDEQIFEKNDFLLKEGKISGYFFLAEGFMRSFTFDDEGNEITTSFYAANRVIFEAASFFLHLPSAENIQAVTKSRGYYTTFEQLNKLFHSIPEFREFGRLILVKEFVSYKQQMLAMINKNAEERYADLIKMNPEIFHYAQLKHIASYLGMTDTSLSRVRKEFSKK